MMSKCRSKGFTLIEVIIAVALVAIMAVAIAPPLVQNIKQGKVARAQSDCQAIGDAVLNFYKDVGDWPYSNDTDPYRDFNRLVSNSSLGGGNSGIPSGISTVQGSSGWSRSGPAETLTDFLIRNRTANRNPLYTASRSPHTIPGWNGPYLDKIPLDPWGNPFVISVRWLEESITGSSSENNDRHNVMVLSAGPNKRFETPFSSSVYDEQVGGDDVGYIFRGSSQR